MYFSYYFHASTRVAYCIANEPLRIDAVRICSEALATDGTNHITLTVAVGGSTIATRTTDSGASGSNLVADTPESLTLTNQDKLHLAAGDVIKITYTVGGTVSSTDFSINIPCTLARDFS